MRKINRSPEPAEFTEFVEAHPRNEWADIHNEAQPLYEQIKLLLLQDQDGRSGYTERKLKADSKLTHIDHFKRKGISAYRNLTYDWYNFVVDEHNRNYGADYKDNIPAAELDYNTLINPIQENAQLFFDYDEDGFMQPKRSMDDNDKKRAKYTIDVFNLNYKDLQEERKSFMREARSYKSIGFSNQEILSWFIGSPFISAIEWELAQD